MNSMDDSPKVLYWDVEVSLKLGYFYDQWNTNIPYHKIKHHSFLISAAWAWESDPEKVSSVSLLDDKPRFICDPRDDYFVVKTIRDVIDKADAIVAHNGDGFDVKELNSRLAQHGLRPTNKPIQIDTLKMAKTHFRYSGGNSLANLCSFFKLDTTKGKITDEVWIAAAEGCPDAIAEVQLYNESDVPPLRSIYLIQRPFAPAKLNQNLFSKEDTCPACGTVDWKKNGTQPGYSLTRITSRQKWACNKCGYSIVDKHTLKSVRLR